MSRGFQKAKYFTMMAEESADIANEEQLVTCFHCEAEDFENHEDFLGIHPLPNAIADSICQGNFGI